MTAYAGTIATPSGLRPGSLRIPYYEALRNAAPSGFETILTFALGNLSRPLQNYADTVADMGARGEDDDAALSSIAGTLHSKQTAAKKKRKRRKSKILELLAEEEEQMDEISAAIARIDELETHVVSVLGVIHGLRRNINEALSALRENEIDICSFHEFAATAEE